MIYLSTIIYGWEPLLLLVIVGLPLAFFTLLPSIYHIEYGEFPSGDAAEVWRTISQTRYVQNDKERFESEVLPVNKEGVLIDPWGNPIRFRLGSDHSMTAYSAGPDGLFSTVDDLPEKWERAIRGRQGE